MDKRNSNKPIVISGASSGIGLALARLLARQGHPLILGARRLDKLSDLKSELENSGSPAVLVQSLDVQEENSCSAFAALSRDFASSYGGIWALCNNAGLALSRSSVLDGNPNEWRTMINTNLMGVLSLTQKLTPQLKKPGGLILMTGSISGHQVYEGGGVYCASKFALKALTQTLRLELNGTGLRVCSVDPGMIETEFSLVRFSGNHEVASKVYDGMTPLSADDVAECMAFMLSRPPHVCIDQLIVLPTDQASVSKVNRQ